MPDNDILQATLKKFSDCLTSEFAEDFLQLLLGLMSIVFLLNPDFRKNIEGFSGRYQFKSRNGCIHVAALFEDNRLKVREGEIPNPNITVYFKDGKALMNYLLTPKPDILGSILRQEVSLDGNFNYLCKFAFMAKRLQLMATGAL
ncbi:hypothetical protein SAMN04489760_12524 [Syntrophus gentianae]|uniref:SCP-2 sterol transfer family protein n=1 Tax=Syntrophus gentianae TaxID=43775 RepID=A0A1H7ZNA3_9BACT|nr:hypothetical protein [Syntrophus gentianae]SEM59731.1 hypothetical protein SAMN04489760_12524 [Syntrophus gentianae]